MVRHDKRRRKIDLISIVSSAQIEEIYPRNKMLGLERIKENFLLGFNLVTTEKLSHL